MADTYLRRSLDSANDKAKHDENVKAILSDRMTPEKKEEILEHTYGIPMSYELKEAAAKMCNLSDLVEERGIELNVVRLVLKKMRKSCTVAQIAEALEESEEKIGRIVEIAQKYAPEYDERKILYEVMSLPKV